MRTAEQMWQEYRDKGLKGCNFHELAERKKTYFLALHTLLHECLESFDESLPDETGAAMLDRIYQETQTFFAEYRMLSASRKR